MQLRSLEHLLDSVLALSRPRKTIVLGSASLLPPFPEVGNVGEPLETTYDADFLLDPIDREIAKMLGEAVGENSLFHSKAGYYADILHPNIVQTLPQNWEQRLRPLPDYDNVWCLDPVDLAMVKVCVGREKDLRLVRELLVRKLIDPQELRERFAEVTAGEKELFRAGRNLANVLGRT